MNLVESLRVIVRALVLPRVVSVLELIRDTYILPLRLRAFLAMRLNLTRLLMLVEVCVSSW